MNKLILDKSLIQELIFVNKFKLEKNKRLFSRCIDGRYPNTQETPALGIAGADAGELMLIAATASTYGFKVDLEKAYQAFLKVMGGVKNLSFHTDDHHDGTVSGCGHIAQIIADPKAYELQEKQVEEILQMFDKAKKEGARESILHGPHLEGGVLMIRGEYGINSQYYFQLGNEKVFSQVFIFHQTLVNERHKAWVKQLCEDQTIELYQGCDAEYLYQAISETTEEHLFETAQRLAKGLNIYSVDFGKDGSFKIGEMGRV